MPRRYEKAALGWGGFLDVYGVYYSSTFTKFSTSLRAEALA